MKLFNDLMRKRDSLKPNRRRFHWFTAVTIGLLLTSIFYFSLPWLVTRLSAANVGTEGVFGIFGAVVGALWATLLAWASSVDLQIRQFQAQALIAKSNEVYRPLFDSAMQLSNALKSQNWRNKYPSSFNIHDRGNQGYSDLKFNIWTTMAGSSTSLRVPEWLRVQLDDLTNDLRQYNNLHPRMVELADAFALQILSERYGRVCRPKAVGTGGMALDALLTDNFASIRNEPAKGLELYVTDGPVETEYATEIWHVLSENLRELEETKEFIACFARIEDKLDNLLKILQQVIDYIRIEHEIGTDVV